MKEIELTHGFIAIVDDDDFEELSKYKWHHSRYGYAARNITTDSGKRMLLYMHISIMGKKQGLEIDHVNGNGLNNRRYNLRHVTRSQNNQNQKPNRDGTSSQYKGVWWSKIRNKWQSQIQKNGKRYNLGYHENEQDAALAYNEAAIEYFGEYARLNTI